MKKLILKSLLFVIPVAMFFLYNAYQNLAKPITSFSFRTWEALSVFKANDILGGPFYPNMNVNMLEEGDLAHGGKWLSLKNVTWFTDSYGYRKRETGKNPEIVIIGDSFTVGTGLTQDDTLSDSLQKKTGLDVYGYAPKTFNNYLAEERFKKKKPKVVILESTEKLVNHSPNIIEPPKKHEVFGIASLKKNPLLLQLAIISDRLERSNFTNTLTSRIDGVFTSFIVETARGLKPKPVVTTIKVVGRPQVSDEPKPVVITPEMSKEEVMALLALNISKDESMVFNRQSEEYFAPVSDRDINNTVDVIASYKNYLESEGIEFIFLLVPNKENIYWQNVRGGSEQDFLERLIIKLKSNNIRVIDTQAAFDSARDKNPNKLIYFIDDGHWNKYGVDITTDLIKEELDRMKN